MKLHLPALLRRILIAALAVSIFPAAAATYEYTSDNWNPTGNEIKHEPTEGGNIVNVNGINASSVRVYGAKAESGDANKNAVTLESKSTLQTVYGGYSTVGAASNEVELLGESTVTLYTNGGYVSGDGVAEGNEVTFSGKSTAKNYICGGYVGGIGTASSNHVTISGNSTAENAIRGGDVYSGGHAVGNTVEISGGSKVKGVIHGGRVSGGNGRGGDDNPVYSSVNQAADNAVTFSGASSTSHAVYGGHATTTGYTRNEDITTSAKNNSVTVVEKSSVSNVIYGGYACISRHQTDIAATTSAENNTVKLSGGSETTHAGGIYGGYAAIDNQYGTSGAITLSAKKNEVSLSEGASAYIVRGGYVYAKFNSSVDDETKEKMTTETITAAAEANIVSITDSKVSNDVFGGVVKDIGGNATNNTVTLKGSTVGRHVYGGYIENGNGNATNNVITLEDSTLSRNVYGGYIKKGSGNATNNTVILKGGKGEGDLSKSVLYGGYADTAYQAESDLVTGNTLVVDGFQGTVKDVKNFEHIVVTLSDWNPDEYVLTTSEEVDLTGVSITLAGIESIAADAELPTGGEAFKLLSNYNPDTTTSETWEGLEGKYRNIRYGETRLVDISIDSADGAGGEDPVTFAGVNDSDTSADVTITSHLNPQLKALSEGRVAALTFVNRAGNLAAEQGVAQAALAAAQEGKKVATFFAMQAGHEKVDSGSYVDADGVATMLGASVSTLKTKALTLGAFVESGWGQYTTHNSFADPAISEVRGTGESSYVGGGVLMRYACSSRRAKGLAVDASLRAGKQDTDFGSYDVRGKYVSYDISNSYMAGHVGASYTFKPVHKVETTVYGRYLWSHVGSEHADTAPDRVDFEASHSNRLRVGARAAWQHFVKWTPYVGLAYEWECSGAARASVSGERVDAPSMRGGSVIGEIGTSWQPLEEKPFWVNASLQGSAGKTQGYSAGIGCTVAF